MFMHPNDYIRIETEKGHLFGGCQSRFPEKKMSGYGCGLIAAADVCLYLSEKKNQVHWKQYEKYIKKIKPYFFYLNHFGMTGWSLAIGMNLVFIRNKLPYFAWWKMFPLHERSKEDIARMLSQNIPVIVSAGANFPNIFGKKSVPLYRKLWDGRFEKVSSFKGHFVTITGMEGDEIQLSSWGNCYYMKWSEYLHYAKKHSLFLFTNYLKIYPLSKE